MGERRSKLRKLGGRKQERRNASTRRVHAGPISPARVLSRRWALERRGLPADRGRILLGWREWVALPALGISAIKAKVDTGARTSALHAENIEIFHASNGVMMARFRVFPFQQSRRGAILCEAPVVDRRTITDSGGHREERWIIRTLIRLAGQEWETEISLTNRDTLSFRMLLGRATLGRRFLINPSASFQAGAPDWMPNTKAPSQNKKPIP